MKKLLAVDDDQRITNHIGRIVIKFGIEYHSIFEYHSINDSLQFENVVSRINPDIIFLDLNMPGFDGIEILSKIPPSCSASIYLISGMSPQIINSTRIIAEEQHNPIKGILQKPFTEKEIKDILVANVGYEQKDLKAAVNVEEMQTLTANDLLSAIKNMEIVPHYQPKISLKTNKLVGVEVLARWFSPDFGQVSPFKFVSMAEKEGVIYELTWHIILEVLKDYKIVSAVSSGIKFSLNISPGLFKIPRFANELLQLFEDFNIPTSQFILEITEAMESDQIPEFLRSLTRLRVKGFELSLDDFGTGNSNTLKLLYLPITELKLDQKFISRVVNNEQAEKLVKSTLELAKTYEVETTAEGIEDANTLFWLKENGCDLAQGYLISKAMDRVSLVNFIERNELDTIIDKIYQKDSPAN